MSLPHCHKYANSDKLLTSVTHMVAWLSWTETQSSFLSVMVASVIQVRRISKHLFEYNLSKENDMVHGGIDARRI